MLLAATDSFSYSQLASPALFLYKTLFSSQFQLSASALLVVVQCGALFNEFFNHSFNYTFFQSFFLCGLYARLTWRGESNNTQLQWEQTPIFCWPRKKMNFISVIGLLNDTAQVEYRSGFANYRLEKVRKSREAMSNSHSFRGCKWAKQLELEIWFDSKLIFYDSVAWGISRGSQTPQWRENGVFMC